MRKMAPLCALDHNIFLESCCRFFFSLFQPFKLTPLAQAQNPIVRVQSFFLKRLDLPHKALTPSLFLSASSVQLGEHLMVPQGTHVGLSAALPEKATRPQGMASSHF